MTRTRSRRRNRRAARGRIARTNGTKTTTTAAATVIVVVVVVLLLATNPSGTVAAFSFGRGSRRATPRPRASGSAIAMAMTGRSSSSSSSSSPRLDDDEPASKFATEPRSAPRFDDFGEILVGEWAVVAAEADADAATAVVVVVGEVEEVMRSCGGAVQGIREPVTGCDRDDDDDEGEGATTYLNRADDGFVFFEDGCYTAGPVSIGMIDDDDIDDRGFLACLALPPEPPPPPDDAGGRRRRRRVVVEASSSGPIASSSGDRAAVDPPSRVATGASLRTKRRFGDDDDVSTDVDGIHGMIRVAETVPSVASGTVSSVEAVARCRMPSRGMPWMLQRAKWETLRLIATEEAVDDDDDDESSSEEKESPPVAGEGGGGGFCECWSISERPREFAERFGLPFEEDDDDDDGDGAVVIHSGAACPATGTLRVVARRYDGSPGTTERLLLFLREVLRVEGTVPLR